MGLTAFVICLDMTGISPLIHASADPTAPSAATTIAVTAASTAVLVAPASAATGPVLTADAHEAFNQTALDAAVDENAVFKSGQKYKSVISQVHDATNNEFPSSVTSVMFIQIGDLNGEAAAALFQLF